MFCQKTLFLSKKLFLHFRKWDFPTFQETEILKKLLIFRQMELFSPGSKKSKKSPKKFFLYFLKKQKIVSYFLGNRNPEEIVANYYFRKSFLIF